MLQKYNFDVNYTPGKLMHVSDALSRNPLDDCEPELSEEELELNIYNVISALPVSDSKLKKLQFETAKDSTLQKFMHYVMKGWPDHRDSLEYDVKPYFSVRDEITVAQNLLLKGDRIIVPSSIHANIRSLVHQGHPGIERCKARARSSVYWPGLSQEINDLVSNCGICQEFRNYQSRETLLPHEVPNVVFIMVLGNIHLNYLVFM